MKIQWLLLVTVALILVKENLCVPAIRPRSQHGILYPVENWDDCIIDEISKQPGLCKKLEECPQLLKKWHEENIYPKTCYFIKKQQFVCCAIDVLNDNSTSGLSTNANTSSTQKPTNIFLDNVNKKTTTASNRPSNVFLDNVYTKTTIPSNRPSNVFLDQVKNRSTTSTTQISNVFLENLKNRTTTSTERPSNDNTDRNPGSEIPNIFNTEKPWLPKRRSEIECDLQNERKFGQIDINGATAFPFMAVIGWKSNDEDRISYACAGVLISSSFVLTSANCAEIGGFRPSFVHVGDENFASLEADAIKIKQFIVHPGHNATTIYNDIALVELEQEVSNPTACLWGHHDLPTTNLTALGYGSTSFDARRSTRLLKASLIAFHKTDCQKYYQLDDKLKTMDIWDTHLCAGNMEKADEACQGDIGGPLLLNLNEGVYVVGVTAYSFRCADIPPPIFTRVPAYIDWLESIVWPEIDVRIERK